MEAEDRGAGGGAAGGEAQGSPGGPGSSGGPGSCEGPRSGGAAQAGASRTGVPPVARALGGPGPGGDAVPGPGGHAGSAPGRVGRRLLHFSLMVPFPSAVQAEIARWFLAPRVQPHPGVIGQLIVSANLLTIRLTAEDPGQFQISVNSCLFQLCVLVQTVRNILRPVFFLMPSPEKRD